MKSPEDECDKHLFEDEVQLYSMYNLHKAPLKFVFSRQPLGPSLE